MIFVNMKKKIKNYSGLSSCKWELKKPDGEISGAQDEVAMIHFLSFEFPSKVALNVK